MVAVAWLVLPQFRGAAFIYDKFVREQLRKHGGGGKAVKNKFLGLGTPKKVII